MSKEKAIAIMDSILEFIIIKVIFGYFDWLESAYTKVEVYFNNRHNTFENKIV